MISRELQVETPRRTTVTRNPSSLARSFVIYPLFAFAGGYGWLGMPTAVGFGALALLCVWMLAVTDRIRCENGRLTRYSWFALRRLRLTVHELEVTLIPEQNWNWPKLRFESGGTSFDLALASTKTGEAWYRSTDLLSLLDCCETFGARVDPSASGAVMAQPHHYPRLRDLVRATISRFQRRA
jgi:hypothetical protein